MLIISKPFYLQSCRNVWQKCHITPLPSVLVSFAQINMFLRKNLIENSNIDVVEGGGDERTQDFT